MSAWDYVRSSCGKYRQDTWYQVCNGFYEYGIIERYLDKLPVVNARYAIFGLGSKWSTDRLLMVYLNVQQCTSLLPLDMNRFHCMKSDGTDMILKTGKSRMVCLRYHFDMVDEMARSCGGTGYSTSAIIYYANIAARLALLEGRSQGLIGHKPKDLRGGGNSMIISNMIILILSVVLVLLCLLRG